MSGAESADARAEIARWVMELQRSPGYRNYEGVREHVLEMKNRATQASDRTRPSDYWQFELDHLDFMIDASPVLIAGLRRHCFYITGIRPYDYRPVFGKSDRRPGFEAKLKALVDVGGSEILVPESPALGGFGYEIGGALYNVDTLKFYEVLIGLDRAGVLDRFRRGEASVLCEIGSGWGGFAYQFKTLFPDATMILVDFPELFLFSATYLLTAFPGARVAFWGEPAAEAALSGPEQLDFVFVPNSEIESLTPPRVDVTVNMVSFQEMTTEQVRGYVQWARSRGSRSLYSLNRDRSAYNPELTNVRELIGETYDTLELDILPVSYTKIVDPWNERAKGRIKAPKKVKPGKEVARPAKVSRLVPDHLDYRHVIGVLRDPP